MQRAAGGALTFQALCSFMSRCQKSSLSMTICACAMTAIARRGGLWRQRRDCFFLQFFSLSFEITKSCKSAYFYCLGCREWSLECTLGA